MNLLVSFSPAALVLLDEGAAFVGEQEGVDVFEVVDVRHKAACCNLAQVWRNGTGWVGESAFFVGGIVCAMPLAAFQNWTPGGITHEC